MKDERLLKSIKEKINEITVNEGSVFLIREEYKSEFPDMYILLEYFEINFGEDISKTVALAFIEICNCLDYSIVYDFGEYEFYSFGVQHRENDLPATVFADGTMHWYMLGKMHRNNSLPALITDNGNVKRWFKNGVEYFPN